MSRSGDAQPLLALGATICATQSSSTAPIGQPSCYVQSPVLQRVGRRLYIQPPDLFLDHLAGLDSQFCSDSIICMPVDVTSALGTEYGVQNGLGARLSPLDERASKEALSNLQRP